MPSLAKNYLVQRKWMLPSLFSATVFSTIYTVCLELLTILLTPVHCLIFLSPSLNKLFITFSFFDLFILVFIAFFKGFRVILIKSTELFFRFYIGWPINLSSHPIPEKSTSSQNISHSGFSRLFVMFSNFTIFFKKTINCCFMQANSYYIFLSFFFW